ncbi:MAG: RidA family protein [Deltaproteobacteria bacterium]|nr:RidA family protein [Deltaproteobacteria bacterium]
MKKAIESKEAPAAIGPYSQAIRAGGMVYVSGMLGIDPADGNLKATVTEQAEQALKNLSAVLKEAGTDTGSVVKTTVFLTDMGAFGAVNEIYARYFTAPFPARSCVQVSALPKGGLFEIEASAEV